MMLTRADELNEHTPTTRGWQSPKHCSYPLELAFQLDAPGITYSLYTSISFIYTDILKFILGSARISQIQLLSHQAKISSKIEIFVGDGDDYEDAVFKRLGYLSLDPNERSAYQARELKTVYVDHVGRFLKLIISGPHPNKINTGNQVGIVAINLIGIEESPLSRQQGNTKSPTRHIAPKDLASEMNLDANTASKLRFLAEVKAQAVAEEDYVTAKAIKAIEVELRSLGARLSQIESAKKDAVRDEDYDKAAMLKDQSRELRADIELKVI
jgi:centrosomal protein CEP104